MLLSQTEIETKLAEVPSWKYEGTELVKEFTFTDFIATIAFVNKVAIFAESMNHHPDLCIHKWNKLIITVSSHDAGGITERDFSLIKKIEMLG
ncbi:MAG: 4a-hydroxytetrahydrobiopterin dehydratase [Ignavibacteriales bacterium]|nr:4a-hydroxytetrahydrobiopterin dehydratase [Ignavibacteriales bacterium]